MAESGKPSAGSGLPGRSALAGLGRGEGLERVYISLLAVFTALIIGAGFILWTGKNPIVGYQALWLGSFGSPQDFAELLVSTTPLIFTGLAVAFAFRAGLFNIGVEGQFIVGQIGAAWAGFFFTGLPVFIHVPLALLSGALIGGLWAGLPGFLKARLGVHEVINTIMMNYIALYFTHWLVMGPLRGHPFLPQTKEILPSAMLYRFLPPTRANIGILVALLAAWFVYYIMWRTTLGYEIRAVGHNPKAAEYGGVNVARNTVVAMLLSGGLAGMGGAVQVLGLQYKFYDIFTFTGYGFDGIAVSLIGGNHPVGILAGATLFGIFARGAQRMQSMADIPKEIIGIVTAIVIILVAADQIMRRFVVRKKEVPGGGNQ